MTLILVRILIGAGEAAEKDVARTGADQSCDGFPSEFDATSRCDPASVRAGGIRPVRLQAVDHRLVYGTALKRVGAPRCGKHKLLRGALHANEYGAIGMAVKHSLSESPDDHVGVVLGHRACRKARTD